MDDGWWVIIQFNIYLNYRQLFERYSNEYDGFILALSLDFLLGSSRVICFNICVDAGQVPHLKFRWDALLMTL